MRLQSDTRQLFQWDLLSVYSLLLVNMRWSETFIIWFWLFHFFLITYTVILILRLIFWFITFLSFLLLLLFCLGFNFFINFLSENFHCWSSSLLEACHLQNLVFAEFSFLLIQWFSLLCDVDFNPSGSKSDHCWEKHHVLLIEFIINFKLVYNFE